MCVPASLLPRPGGASLALLLVLMEYPLPGPVVALLSQEKAALAPKSYLISSCKKSIKITLVYAKDQQGEEHNLVPATLASTTPAATSAAAAASAVPMASVSKASSASSLMSSSSSLSSSAERKKPRHASSSSRQNRKKKKKSKSSRKSNRSTSSGIMVPRVSKLSESSSSPTSEPDVGCSGGRGGTSAGGSRVRGAEPRRANDNSGRGDDSCSTPEFPLLFGGHDGEMVGRERMSTVDSGVPSSNGTMAYEQTAESGASDEDRDINDVVDVKNPRDGAGSRRERPLLLSAPGDRAKPEARGGLLHTPGKKDNQGGRTLPVDLPRRTRGISDSSISSLSSSDDDEKGKKSTTLPSKESKIATSAATGVAASTSLMSLGAETPIRREEQWQTWTRIPRTQAPSTSGRQKLTAVPSVASRPITSSSESGAVGGASRAAVHHNTHGPTGGSRTNQSEAGASWDGAENL